MAGWWRWALVSPDGVAPSQVVSVFASGNLPLHHKFQKFSSGTGSSGWSRKKGRKVVVGCGDCNNCTSMPKTMALDGCFLHCCSGDVYVIHRISDIKTFYYVTVLTVRAVLPLSCD